MLINLPTMIMAAATTLTIMLPTPIAIQSKYSPDQQQMIVEIAEGMDGRFHPFHTRSEKAAHEKKVADEKRAEEARIKAEAEKKAAEEAARIAAEKAAAEAEAQRQALAAAEAERARQAAQVKPQPRQLFGGSCADWIAAAGIGEVGMANELIRRESGCDPYARNPSSGACGVAQELPCGKSGCSLGDGACQVAWMNRYVLGRYGSWSAAVRFHDANNWY
jgi:hypothetical protein